MMGARVGRRIEKEREREGRRGGGGGGGSREVGIQGQSDI